MNHCRWRRFTMRCSNSCAGGFDAVLFLVPPRGKCVCRRTADDPGRRHPFAPPRSLPKSYGGILPRNSRLRFGSDTVADGKGHRLYQIRKPKNRHLVDVRAGVDGLPAHQVVEEVLVVPPADLIGQKIQSMVNRSQSAKGPTDLTDIRRLLLTFPELKTFEGSVTDRLQATGASGAALEAWREIAAQEIAADDDDEGGIEYSETTFVNDFTLSDRAHPFFRSLLPQRLLSARRFFSLRCGRRWRNVDIDSL